MKAPAGEAALTFPWPRERGFPFVLFVCVLASFVAHAATFFLFQVVYPQRVTIAQPAPHLSLLTPSSPENIAFLRWVEAEDPALVARDNSLVPAAMPEVRYRPSYAVSRTALLGAPADQHQAVRFPPAEDRLTAADAARPQPPAASVPQPTSVSFSGPLAARPLASNPALVFPQHSAASAEPTAWLIGVNREGEIRFTFLQQPSGNPLLDGLAAEHLSRLAFAPSETPITWGFATFVWGTDAYSADKPNSE